MKNLIIVTSFITLITGFGFSGTLTVIHGIPGDSLGLDRPLNVDVYVNEAYEAPAFSFEFTESVDNLDLAAGDYTFEVFVGGSDPASTDPVLSADANITEEGNFTAIAHLTYSGDPDQPGIALTVFENETSPLATRNARLGLRHTANAPGVAVEIQRFLHYALPYWPYVTFPGFSNNDGEGPSEIVVDIQGGYLVVNLLAGGEQVFTTGRFQLPRASNVYAYAIGDFFSDSFQLFLQPIG